MAEKKIGGRSRPAGIRETRVERWRRVMKRKFIFYEKFSPPPPPRRRRAIPRTTRKSVRPETTLAKVAIEITKISRVEKIFHTFSLVVVGGEISTSPTASSNMTRFSSAIACFSLSIFLQLFWRVRGGGGEKIDLKIRENISDADRSVSAASARVVDANSAAHRHAAATVIAKLKKRKDLGGCGAAADLGVNLKVFLVGTHAMANPTILEKSVETFEATTRGQHQKFHKTVTVDFLDISAALVPASVTLFSTDAVCAQLEF